MADKQDAWLDAEVAERLLRGESPDNAVAPAARTDAARLAEALDALAVPAPAADDCELPGEAAALAAFRKAHADRGATETVRSSAGSGPDDVGLVRIGARDVPARRSRRPVRFALAASLALGMVGGVAAAVAAGVLPTFGGDPGPEASVSAAVTPDRPLVSPTPDGTGGDAATPDGSTGAADPGAGRDTAGDATAPGTDGQEGKKDWGHGWWSGTTSACRTLREGGQLSEDRGRALEKVAGGSAKVDSFCSDVLAYYDQYTDGRSGDGHGDDGDGDGDSGFSDKSGDGKGGDDSGDGGDNDEGGGRGFTKGNGNGNGGNNGGGNNGNGNGNGNDHGTDGGVSTTAPSALTPLQPRGSQEPGTRSPGPSYTALADAHPSELRFSGA
ncbi:hypothetical protein ACIPSE_03085 [Streptomyces sp. NPDC090106]|uniref:hypothetical protein n=1 Tax=Streptomyces sp. NPDC090106 TaxID=3365946 RepID=UPI003812F9E9